MIDLYTDGRISSGSRLVAACTSRKKNKERVVFVNPEKIAAASNWRRKRQDIVMVETRSRGMDVELLRRRESALGFFYFILIAATHQRDHNDSDRIPFFSSFFPFFLCSGTLGSLTAGV